MVDEKDFNHSGTSTLITDDEDLIDTGSGLKSTTPISKSKDDNLILDDDGKYHQSATTFNEYSDDEEDLIHHSEIATTPSYFSDDEDLADDGSGSKINSSTPLTRSDADLILDDEDTDITSGSATTPLHEFSDDENDFHHSGKSTTSGYLSDDEDLVVDDSGLTTKVADLMLIKDPSHSGSGSGTSGIFYDDEDLIDSGSGFLSTTPSYFTDDYDEDGVSNSDDLILSEEDLEYYDDENSSDDEFERFRRSHDDLMMEITSSDDQLSIADILALDDENEYNYDENSIEKLLALENDEDKSIVLLLDDKKEGFRPDFTNDKSIENLLALDDDDNKNHRNLEIVKSVTVEQNTATISGLDSCTSYTMDIKTVYDHNVAVTSKEKFFKTECEPICDTSNIDFQFNLKDETKMAITVLNENSCVTDYAFKLCFNISCGAVKNYKSTNSIIDIDEDFMACLNYEFFITPLFNGRETTEMVEIKKYFNYTSTVQQLNKEDCSVKTSLENLTISWKSPRGCLEGYSLIISEIRHLPNLLPKYVDEDSEHVVHTSSLPADQTSLTLSNLSSCMLHRAEIYSFYQCEYNKRIKKCYFDFISF